MLNSIGLVATFKKKEVIIFKPKNSPLPTDLFVPPYLKLGYPAFSGAYTFLGREVLQIFEKGSSYLLKM